MKKLISFAMLLSFSFLFYPIFAEKPFDERNKTDVMAYFEANNIIFDGEYANTTNNQNIIVGRLNSRTKTVSMNFFLSDGKLVKALLTTPVNSTLRSLL